MKKTILITIGTLIILGVVGVWIYLFTYGTPQNADEVFGRFGIGNNAQTEFAPIQTNNPAVIDVGETTDEGAGQRLKQLTTRPVAGATFVGSEILYVEQGTGHIYSINLDTGKETLVNGTTIKQSAEAVFSSDGSYVAITIYETTGNTVIVERTSMETGAGEGITLPRGATEVAFGSDPHTVHYILKDINGASGYLYDIIKESSVTVFTVPLRDIQVLWGTPTYIYTTPTATAIGFIYRLDGNILSYVTRGGFGLTGLSYKGGVAVTKSAGNTLRSFTISTNDTSLNMPVVLIPEKCTSLNSTLFCAAPNTNLDPQTFPDSWYKGIVSYTDILWSIDVTTGVATVLSNFLKESGREVDVTKIGIDDAGKRIYFVNKNNNTLWMLDTTI